MTSEQLNRANDLKIRIDNLKNFICPRIRRLNIIYISKNLLKFRRPSGPDIKEIELSDQKTIDAVYAALNDRLHNLEAEFEAIGAKNVDEKEDA